MRLFILITVDITRLLRLKGGLDQDGTRVVQEWYKSGTVAITSGTLNSV